MYMYKWYKTNAAKLILIIVAIITPAVAALSFAILENASAARGSFFEPSSRVYEESGAFQDLMQIAAVDVLNQVNLKEDLETDGVYDPDKLVDIVEYYDKNTVSSENASGLSYTVEQLADWGEKIDNGELTYGNDVVVCQKPDGSYHYYYMSEFEALLSEKKLRLELDADEMDYFLSNLKGGDYNSSYDSENIVIKDENGETEYTGCWSFKEALVDKFAPAGASSLLEVVNENTELNGELSKVYQYLENAAYSFENMRSEYLGIGDQWKEGNTNFLYLYLDADAKRVYTNNSAWQDYEKAKEALTLFQSEELSEEDQNLQYIMARPTRKEFVSNIDAEVDVKEWQSLISGYVDLEGEDAFLTAVDTSYPIQDVFYTNMKEYNANQPYMNISKAGFLLSVVLFITAIVWLTWIAGRRADSEELYLCRFDRLKTEIAAAVVVGVWILLTLGIAGIWSLNGSVYYYISDDYPVMTSFMTNAQVIILVIYAALTAVMFLIGYLSLVRRIKARTVWKNSLLLIICSGLLKCLKVINEFWRNRNLIWRRAIVYLVFLIINWFAPNSYTTLPILLMFAVDIVIGYYLFRETIARQKIKTGVEKIAGGEVDYRIPLDKMNGSVRDVAEQINSIGEGMNLALEARMKSERLKTDLITNVSHDIKTPLTSIINYVDLLKQEEFDDPKIQRYLEILEAKSQRLKMLTEDVVEASKVSSGNITLEYTNINLVEMIQQTSGEFAEKFAARGLREILSLPEEPVIIRVDGRRMWRILSNIYSNAAKYAMEGTRVYADLRIVNGNAQFSLKNISEQQLNISADELTERFIRGDVSRSTEGSGLGLSIAETLTKMQGGTFDLYLDGDLFRVTIIFPTI